MSVEAVHAFQLKMMGVNLEKLSALSSICLFCAYFWNSFMWVGKGYMLHDISGYVVYWHFDEVSFFLHCPQEWDGLLCPFPHFYVMGRTLFSLWGLYFILFLVNKKNLLLPWVNFSLVLGILLVMLHLGESSQESKLLRLPGGRNSICPGPWQLHWNS